MQAHPEFSVQGLQYRENTVSLYPWPFIILSPLYKKQTKKYLLTFYGNEVNKSMNKFSVNASHRQGIRLVQEVKYPLL